MLKIYENRNELLLDGNVEQFLLALRQPSIIRLQGRDAQRRRALCTLLHGNEPSGVRAIHAYLQSGAVPAVNVDFIIAAIPTALTPPHFTHRMLPQRRDLNRCFRPPFAEEEGQLAQAILKYLNETQPECLIDLHNTSGSGPAFGVAINGDRDHLALTSLWTNDLIVTDLRLGALMEISEATLPTVTIECGGAYDQTSLLIAREGLQRYMQSTQVLAAKTGEYAVSCHHNPIRLELKPGYSIRYGETSSEEVALLMSADAARFNYGSVPKDEAIGVLGPEGLAALTAKDHLGQERLHEHFCAYDGKLYPRHPLKLFMVTTNPLIAAKDCLFYFIDCAHD